MLTLIIDTALGACQAALARDGALIAARSDPMERGHQERIAPMAAEVMAEAGVAFADLERIAVTLGPGSFTGVRVGLAFARGLRLATGADLAGVGTLEALAAGAASERHAGGVIDARRGQVYAQVFQAGRPPGPAEVVTAEEAALRFEDLARDGGLAVVGPGAARFAALAGVTVAERAAPDLAILARLAARPAPLSDPRPIYLRAPDIRGPAA